MFPKKAVYRIDGNGLYDEIIHCQKELDDLEKWVDMNHGELIVAEE